MTTNQAIDYLNREGNFRVPCSRYGRDTAECARVAYASDVIASSMNGEGMSETSLDYMMGLVVNDSDDVEYLIREYGPVYGFDPDDYLS